MWIARTKGMPEQISMFTSKPHWSTVDGWTCGRDCDNFEIGRIGWLHDIDGTMCPNLTEDEPIEVEIVSKKFMDNWRKVNAIIENLSNLEKGSQDQFDIPSEKLDAIESDLF